MAATYSGNPASSARDLLRFKIGDTAVASALLEDEELDYVISVQGTLVRQIADCFEAIGHKLLQQPNFALDKWREDRHAVAESFIKRAQELRKRGAAAGLYAGGLTKTDKASREEDTDRVQPFAYMGMDEFPEDQNPEADSDEDSE